MATTGKDYTLKYSTNKKALIIFSKGSQKAEFKPFLKSFSFERNTDSRTTQAINGFFQKSNIVFDASNPIYNLSFSVPAGSVSEAVTNHSNIQKLLRMAYPYPIGMEHQTLLAWFQVQFSNLITDSAILSAATMKHLVHERERSENKSNFTSQLEAALPDKPSGPVEWMDTPNMDHLSPGEKQKYTTEFENLQLRGKGSGPWEEYGNQSESQRIEKHWDLEDEVEGTQDAFSKKTPTAPWGEKAMGVLNYQRASKGTDDWLDKYKPSFGVDAKNLSPDQTPTLTVDELIKSVDEEDKKSPSQEETEPKVVSKSSTDSTPSLGRPVTVYTSKISYSPMLDMGFYEHEGMLFAKNYEVTLTLVSVSDEMGLYKLG